MSQPSEFEPRIIRHRISEIEIFEVTVQELDALEGAFAQESRNLAFFTGDLSISATCAISWLTIGNALIPTAHGIWLA